MVDALSAALSGMKVSQQQQDVIANNIANTNTPDFQSNEVVQSEAAAGGVVSSGIVENGEPDLVRDLVGMQVAENAYKANVVAAKTALRIYQDILEIGNNK